MNVSKPQNGEGCFRQKQNFAGFGLRQMPKTNGQGAVKNVPCPYFVVFVNKNAFFCVLSQCNFFVGSFFVRNWKKQWLCFPKSIDNFNVKCYNGVRKLSRYSTILISAQKTTINCHFE